MDMPFYLYINISNMGIGERNEKIPQYVQAHFFFEKNKEIRYNKSVISGRNSPEDKERRIKCISLILMM